MVDTGMFISSLVWCLCSKVLESRVVVLCFRILDIVLYREDCASVVYFVSVSVEHVGASFGNEFHI